MPVNMNTKMGYKLTLIAHFNRYVSPAEASSYFILRHSSILLAFMRG
jgi:hypothetical protein